MVRCFIAILPPDEIKTKVVSVQNLLKGLPMVCKFVEPENLHISLSFIGEVEDSKIDEIKHKLDSICKNHQRFEIKIGNLKLIPNENYIRVVALDVDTSPSLGILSRDIKKEIGSDVKPPHLTLCRVKSIKDKQKLVSVARDTSTFVGNFVVSSVCLMKSVLQRTGPIYTIIHKSTIS
jgi:2'-5' RNA ligase